MSFRARIACCLLLTSALLPQARALLNFNEGKDLVFVTATYSIGLDTNVFTRKQANSSTTHTLAVSADYTRNAGLISVAANVSASAGRFDDVPGQDFSDPKFAVSFRKRYGRTTGILGFTGGRESQPDPDAGQRTRSWSTNSNLNLRYPVNDRYYLTNTFAASTRIYDNSNAFSNLWNYSEAFAVNYVYSSKLDLNGGYTVALSETSRNTTAWDQSLTVGASGGILPKLSGSVRAGLQRRDSESTIGGDEAFYSFTSGTTLKWLYSRKMSFNADFNQDFSTTSTDISVNRASAGLNATFSLSSKYIANAGVSYTLSDYLGRAGEIPGPNGSTGINRKDYMFSFNASIGAALTTHIRTSLAYSYTLNTSNLSSASFERQSLALTIVATY